MPSFSLLPSKPKFFDLYEQASANLADAARALRNLLEHYEDVEKKVAAITALEQKGDSIVHEVTELAATSLIAPLDHEDTQALISALDTALDTIEAAAVRMTIFHVEQPTEKARKLAELIDRGAQELHEALPGLRSRQLLAKVRNHIVTINRLENEGDQALRQGLDELVDHREDMFNLIRWKEIYEHLEQATDDIEDIGDVLMRVLIKRG